MPSGGKKQLPHVHKRVFCGRVIFKGMERKCWFSMSVAENILRIRERIDAAARQTGRSGEDIILVGASKLNPAQSCREAAAAGIDALGENRVQEMIGKMAENAYEGVPLHFIGHLQRNKVKQVVGQVALIQSAGSVELLREIEKAAAARNLVQPVLLEVNIGAESSKSGFLPENLSEGAQTALSLPHVRVEGLMTIPPADADSALNRHYFDKVYTLYVDMGKNLFHNGFRYLSMGMSGDFEDAIRAGANMVRVGTAIFGTRHYTA